MILPEPLLAPPPLHEDVVRLRLTKLVLAHAVLCAAPLLTAFQAPGNWTSLMFLALEALMLGSLMTLAFWLGMGGGGFLRRLLLASLAALVASFWQALARALDRRRFAGGEMSFEFGEIFSTAGMLAVFVGILAAAFLVARIWLIVVRPLVPDDQPRRNWIKFSMFHLLGAMTLCAVAFALIRTARTDSQGAGGGLVEVAVFCVAFGIYFSNTFVAATAALGRKPLAPRIAITLLVAVALGVVLSFAAGHDQVSWHLMASGPIVLVVSTAVIVASLLVVRSCGYRLVRRPSRTWTPTPNDPFAPKVSPCAIVPSAN